MLDITGLAECIVSGIRPQIAQTIVHPGANLNGVISNATLASALQTALRRTGQSVKRAESVKVSNQRHFTVDHIPNLKVNSFLLATIQVELHDECAMSLQKQGAGISDFACASATRWRWRFLMGSARRRTAWRGGMLVLASA